MQKKMLFLLLLNITQLDTMLHLNKSFLNKKTFKQKKQLKVKNKYISRRFFTNDDKNIDPKDINDHSDIKDDYFKNMWFIRRQGIGMMFYAEPPLIAILDTQDNQRDKKKLLIFLIKHGANPNTPDSFGDTPLHNAVLYNEVEVVKLLIAVGADHNKKNNSGKTPLDIAIEFQADEDKTKQDELRKNKLLSIIGLQGQLSDYKDFTEVINYLSSLNSHNKE